MKVLPLFGFAVATLSSWGAAEIEARQAVASTTNTNVTLSETFCDTAYGNKTPTATPTSNVTWTWSTTSTVYGHKQIVTVSPATNQTVKTVRRTTTTTSTSQITYTNTTTSTTTTTITSYTTIADLDKRSSSVKTVTRTIPTGKGFVPILSQSKDSSWGHSTSHALKTTAIAAREDAVEAEPTPAVQHRDVNIEARFEGVPGTVIQNVTCCTQFFVWNTVTSPDATTTITSHTGRVRTITSVIISTNTVTTKLGPTTTTVTTTSTGTTTTTSTVTPTPTSSSSSSSSTSTSDTTSSSSSGAAATTSGTSSSTSDTTSSSSSGAAATTSSTSSSSSGAGAATTSSTTSSSTDSSSPPVAAAATTSTTSSGTPVKHFADAQTTTTTAYAQCAPNNAMSTFGAAPSHLVASAEATYWATAPGIAAPHGCCVECARHSTCAGYMFVSGDGSKSNTQSRCTLFITKTCAPAKKAWSFHSAKATSPQNAAKVVVGNGACGLANYLGDAT